MSLFMYSSHLEYFVLKKGKNDFLCSQKENTILWVWFTLLIFHVQ